MKKLIDILAFLILTSLATPVSAYTVSVVAQPEEGGYAYSSETEYEEGESVYVYVRINGGFIFQGWMLDDEIVSTYENYYFKMPARDVALKAVFVYDPAVPGNPEPIPVTRILTARVSPEDAGFTDYMDGENVEVGSRVVVKSRPSDDGFKFQYWKDSTGEIVSYYDWFYYDMPDHDETFTAYYVYDPDSPGNPSPNHFYEESGLLVMDGFEPGWLLSTVNEMISNEYDKLRTLVVIGRMTESDFGYSRYSKMDSIDLSRTYGYETIKEYAFDKTNLKKVILPSCIKRINRYAFSNIIESLVLPAPEPPVVDQRSLAGLNREKCIVYVPASSVSVYKETEYWKNFEIRPIDGFGEIPVPVEPPVASVEDGTALYHGSEVCLSAVTPDAAIFYTLDGSDPRDSDGSRLRYENPIVVDRDMEIKAVALVADGSSSEVAAFSYSLIRNSLDLCLKNGWTWVSHNFAEEIKLDLLSAEDCIVRIVGDEGEYSRDSNGSVEGELSGLLPGRAYKVMCSEEKELHFSEPAINPAIPVPVHEGLNSIGCPLDRISSLSDALAGADEGDYIVGQRGFAVWHGGEWTGTLDIVEPGAGYIYGCSGAKEISFRVDGISDSGDDAVSGDSDLMEYVYRFPDIMPVIACLKNKTGEDLSADAYDIMALVGDDCRGNGKVAGGMVLMSVYGETGESVSYEAVGSDDVYTVASDVSSIAEQLQGSFASPAVMLVDENSGVDSVCLEDGVRVSVSHRVMKIEGVDSHGTVNVSVFDSCGRTVFKTDAAADSSISLDRFPQGVYIAKVKTADATIPLKFLLK